MKSDVVILGGGVTGLAAARRLQIDTCLYEKESTLGGCLRSDRVSGYTIDRTGHVLHFRDPYVRGLLFDELSIEWLQYQRRAEIHILNGRTPYPIQYHLASLPVEVRDRCLESYLRASNNRPSYQESFENWSRLAYGDRLHDLFFGPYNRKLWQADLAGITAEWAERFVPKPDRDLVVAGALGRHSQDSFGYNAEFSYPRRGGAQAIVEALSAGISAQVHTGSELLSVDLDSRVCEFSDGSRVHFRALVSTLPLPRLLRSIHRLDDDILALGNGLRHTSVFYLALGFRRHGSPAPPQHWIYLPEPNFLSYRIGVLSNYSPEISPSDSVLLCAEISFSGDDARRADPDAMRGHVLADLDELGILQPGWELELEHHGSIDCAYVIFDSLRRDALPKIFGYLNSKGVYSIGRYGAWGYGSVQDALIEGRDCADLLNREFGRRILTAACSRAPKAENNDRNVETFPRDKRSSQ